MRSFIPILLLLAACSKAPEPGPSAKAPATAVTPSSAPAAPVLSLEGYGPVKFGAELAQVERQLGIKPTAPGVSDPGCSMVRFQSLPGVRFMVEQGKITRADADAGVVNSLDLRIGDTLPAAQAKVATLEVGPHKYLPEGHYLTAKSPDGRAAIIMEEDGKTITKIRAGLQPAVAYVETCL
jgi:hypothetical protein